ncbi:MAG: hypothetical protein ACJ73L_12445 [Actinomycetes bacterium]
MESRIKISSLWFDAREELKTATFWVTLSAHCAVAEALNVSVEAVFSPDQGMAISLSPGQMRIVAERFKAAPEGSVEWEVFTRTASVLSTFRL